MANFGGDDIDKVITGGIVFSGDFRKLERQSENQSQKESLYHGGARFRVGQNES